MSGIKRYRVDATKGQWCLKPFAEGDCVLYADHIAELAALRADAAQMKLALRFYADRDRYHGPNQRNDAGDFYTDRDAPYMQDVTRDGGAIARAALNIVELDAMQAAP